MRLGLQAEVTTVSLDKRGPNYRQGRAALRPMRSALGFFGPFHFPNPSLPHLKRPLFNATHSPYHSPCQRRGKSAIYFHPRGTLQSVHFNNFFITHSRARICFPFLLSSFHKRPKRRPSAIHRRKRNDWKARIACAP